MKLRLDRFGRQSPRKEGSVAVIKPQKELLVFLMRNLPISRHSLDFDDVSLLHLATSGLSSATHERWPPLTSADPRSETRTGGAPWLRVASKGRPGPTNV